MLLLLFFLSILLWTSSSYADSRFASDTQGIIDRLWIPTSTRATLPPRQDTAIPSRTRILRGSRITRKMIRADNHLSHYSSRPHLLEKQKKTAATPKPTEIHPMSRRVNLKLQFAHNSAEIQVNSYPLLKALGDALNSPKLANETLTIAGHTDTDGSSVYNLQLSQQRAQAIKVYLQQHYAISPLRLRIIGYGESTPLVPNNSPHNKQLNRRVEVINKH